MGEKVKANPPHQEIPVHQHKDFTLLAREASVEGDPDTAAKYYAQAAEQHVAELALINSVQAGLSANLEMETIYNLVGDLLRETFDAQIVMISQYDPATKRIFHHYAIEKGVHLHITSWLPIDSSRAEIVRTRRPYMINLREILRLLEAEKMHIVPGTKLPKTWMGVPMLVGNEVRGIVSLQNLDKENAFSPSDIDLLMTLTNSMSMSLENARLFSETQRLLQRLEEEIRVARQTQKSILPRRLPQHPGWEFGSLIIPARGVGGDFYDFIPLANDRLCVVVGDVSDKGLPAALFMALTFSLIRAVTGQAENPLQVLLEVNRYLLKMNASGMFVTLLYGVLDFRTGVLHYSRAGHLPPILLDEMGLCLEVPVTNGQPLGLFNKIQIDQQEVTIPPGGLVLLFSDGLNEASDTLGNEYGFQRIKEELCRYQGETGSVICKKLWQSVKAYSSEMFPQDDFTTVVIKRHK